MTKRRPPDPESPPPDRPIDEGVLLGYLMLSDPHPDAIATIQPALFRNLGHRLALATITNLRNDGAKACPMAVSAALERSGDLETAGGRGYLCSLTDGVPQGPLGWPMLRPYLETVQQAATKHRLQLLAADLASATNNGHEPEDIAALAQGIIKAASLEEGKQVLTPLDLSVTPEPPRWLVKGLIPEGGRCLVVGESNAGKTWLALDLALAVITGSSWLGLEEHPIASNTGPVLVIDEEAPPGTLQWRLSRLARGRGLDITDAELRAQLIAYSLQGIRVSDSTRWPALVDVVKKNSACLVILDPAIAFLGGSDTDDELVAVFWDKVADLQRAGAAVLVIHHTGWIEKDRPRGHTSWRDRTDVELDLATHRDAGPDGIRIAWGKGRDTAKARPLLVGRTFTQHDVTLSYIGEVDKPNGPDLEAAILDLIDGAGTPRATIVSTLCPDGNGIRWLDATIAKLRKCGKITTRQRLYFPV